MSPRPSVEDERREEILRATCEQIAAVGFRRVRIADVAATIGASTGIIHYYFQTKDDLLDAAFEHVAAESRRRSLAAMAGLDDPWERLVALLDAHLPVAGGQQEWLVWMHLWAEAVARPEVRRLDQTSYRGWLDLVEAVVTEGRRSGAFRTVDSRDFVLRLLPMMDGLVIQRTMGLREVSVARIRELLVGFAADQLLGGPAPLTTS